MQWRLFIEIIRNYWSNKFETFLMGTKPYRQAFFLGKGSVHLLSEKISNFRIICWLFVKCSWLATKVYSCLRYQTNIQKSDPSFNTIEPKNLWMMILCWLLYFCLCIGNQVYSTALLLVLILETQPIFCYICLGNLFFGIHWDASSLSFHFATDW